MLVVMHSNIQRQSCPLFFVLSLGSVLRDVVLPSSGHHKGNSNHAEMFHCPGHLEFSKDTIRVVNFVSSIAKMQREGLTTGNYNW